MYNGISQNELGVVFNEQHSRDFGLRLQTVADSPVPTISDISQDIGSVIGELYEGTSIQSKTINIGFHLVGANSHQDVEKRIHVIASWLMPDGNEHAFRIDTFPGWEFYAHVSANFDITQSLYDGTFVVPFTCSDPRAYSPHRRYMVGIPDQTIGGDKPYTLATRNYVDSPESYVIAENNNDQLQTLAFPLNTVNASDVQGKTVLVRFTANIRNAQLLNGQCQVGIEFKDGNGLFLALDPGSGYQDVYTGVVTIPSDFTFSTSSDVKADGQLFDTQGTFTVNTTVNVRKSATTDGTATAQYTSGMSFNYSGKMWNAGYLWAVYTSYTGKKSYVAIGTVDGTRYGTDSNADSDPQTTITTSYPRMIVEASGEYVSIGYPQITTVDDKLPHKAYELVSDFVYNYTGKAHIVGDWHKSDDITEANVDIIVSDDSGNITSTIPLSHNNTTAVSASFDVVIDWTAIDASEHAYIALTSVAGNGEFTIDDIGVFKGDGTVDGSTIVDADTGEDATDLMEHVDDGIVQIHDTKSNADAYPEFTLIATKDISNIEIINKENQEHVMLGVDPENDTTGIVNKSEPLRVDDKCNTLDTWATITDSTKVPWTLQNGYVSSTAKMTSYPNSIAMAKDKDGNQEFGTLKRHIFCGAVAQHSSFSSSYTDWRIVWRAELTARTAGAGGKIELYLLDPSNQRIGKIMLKDNDKTTNVTLQCQIGTDTNYHEVFMDKTGKGHTSANKTDTPYTSEQEKGTSSVGSFANFYGDITFQKKGNVYSAAIMKRTDKGLPAWNKPATASWTDSAGTYSKNTLSSVGLFMAKLPTASDFATTKKAKSKAKGKKKTTTTTVKKDDIPRCDDLKVYEIIDGTSSNNSDDESPDIIAHAGDEIKISTETGVVYKNGSPFNNVGGTLLKSPDSNIPALKVPAGKTRTYVMNPTDQWIIGYRSVTY